MVCEPVIWREGVLRIIDQTRLPGEFQYVDLNTIERVWDAIKTLKVRGAPAIGICAAFGVLVAVQQSGASTAAAAIRAARDAADYLATSRPTAVNLFWALDRMRLAADGAGVNMSVNALFERLESEALAILAEDLEISRQIGEAGAPLIPEGGGVLTHCNAGGLATGGSGTALAALFHAHASGRSFRAYAGETRPLLQGARLTTWELQRAGIDLTLICDNMVAQVMREGKIDVVITGADRVAANGDSANKIGTYGVALLARAHAIPFYIAIPTTTLDLSLPDGAAIPIEQRDPDEVTTLLGQRVAPAGVAAYNPAFDVTPASLIAGIITEHGIVRPPFKEGLRRVCPSASEPTGITATCQQ